MAAFKLDAPPSQSEWGARLVPGLLPYRLLRSGDGGAALVALVPQLFFLGVCVIAFLLILTPAERQKKEEKEKEEKKPSAGTQ